VCGCVRCGGWGEGAVGAVFSAGTRDEGGVGVQQTHAYVRALLSCMNKISPSECPISRPDGHQPSKHGYLLCAEAGMGRQLQLGSNSSEPVARMLGHVRHATPKLYLSDR
jgi:hypothetical protein